MSPENLNKLSVKTLNKRLKTAKGEYFDALMAALIKKSEPRVKISSLGLGISGHKTNKETGEKGGRSISTNSNRQG